MGRLHMVEVKDTSSTRPGIPGTPEGLPPGIKYIEHNLIKNIEAALGDDAMESWVEAGGYGTPNIAGKITEQDSIDGVSLWIADNTSLTRQSLPTVMGGQNRWVTSGHPTEGFRGTLGSAPANWDGYAIWLPDLEINSLAAISMLFSVGFGATTRLQLFVTNVGNLVFNNGTGGSQIAVAAGIQTGVRYTVMASYDAEDDSAALFLNSATPIGEGSISQGPPNETSAGWFGSIADNVSSNLKASSGLVLNKPVHGNGDLVEAMMSVGEQIRTYTPTS